MPADILSLLAGDEPTALEKAQLQVAALRGQNNLGMLGALSGNNVIAPVGQHLMQDSQQGLQQLAGVPQQRLQLAMERLRQEKAQGEQQALQTPAAARVLRLALGKFMPELGQAEDVPAQTAQQMLPVAEKAFSAQQSADARKEAAQTAAEARRFTAQQMGQARQDSSAQREDARTDKDFVAFGNALNLARGRQGEAGKAMGTLNQIARDEVLAKANGGNLTPQQMYELARGLDRAISGAAPTIGSTEHLVPKSWSGDLAGFAQWLTNQPKGAGQQAFVKQVQDTLERIRGQTQQFANETNAKTVNAYSHLAKKDRPRFVAAIGSAGLDPNEFDQNTWTWRGGTARAPGDAPQASGPQQIASDAEYEALPSGASFIGPDGKHRRKP